MYRFLSALRSSFPFLLILAGCQATALPPDQPRGIQHVVVIGVDGMSPDGIRGADTPVLDALIAGGAATMHARAVLPTSSSPNWASMIMGAGPEQHGITSNGWERDGHTLPAVVLGSEAPLFPTIFGLLREQRPDARIGAVYHWGGFGRLFEKRSVTLDRHGETEYATAEAAATFIRTQHPTFTFVHLDHVDGAGHGAGHGTPAYYRAVTRADSLIGQVLQATRDAGIDEETLVIVSSDHGGLGTGHGGESLEEIEIPFILYGRGVKRGYTIPHPVYTYDNAATVAFALGLTPPSAWIGRPVRSAFEGFPDPPAESATLPLPAPTIFPDRQAYAPPGGLFVDALPEVRMQSTEAGAVIRYTLDGSDPGPDAPAYEAPFTLDRSTVVRARAFTPDDRRSRTATAYFRLADTAAGPGLRYQYYEGAFADALPNLDRLQPVRSGTAYEVRLAEVQPEAASFAVRFSGMLRIDDPGTYTFATISDDGSKLYVDGREVVDNDGSHGPTERSGTIDLEAGWHRIEVVYFQEGGGYWLDAYYAGPGVPRQIIPADRLRST